MSINQNSIGNNIFSVFPEYKEGKTLTIAKTPIKVGNVLENRISTDTVELSGENKSKTRKRKILFGSTLASTILTAGLGCLLLIKGVHGSAFSKIGKKLSSNLVKLNKNSTKDFATKTVYYSQKGTKKVVDVLEGTSNFTAMKDFLSNKLFGLTKVTKKFADKSTSFFKKIVDNTLGKKYDKVGVSVKNLTSLIKEGNIETLKKLPETQRKSPITIKGITKTLDEWIEILANNTDDLQQIYNKNFSLGARRGRDKIRTQMLSDLPQKIQERFFKDKKSLFKLSNYKTYATADLTKETQANLAENIVSAKKSLTNNINSITDDLKTTVGKISDSINIGDDVSRESIKILKSGIDKFKNCSGANESNTRKEVVNELQKSINKIREQISNSALYGDDEIKSLETLVKTLDDTLTSSIQSSSKGSLEEIMTILNGLNKANRRIISDESYKELKKLSKQISKNLDKATELEMGEYFLKQAELKVGSAPTDVLSVLLPVGVGAYSIAKGENKDEKISATLTTCIPLVGTFATFVYGTVKMLSGAKNLVFSAVTGLLLGELGNRADKIYKNYRAKGSIKEVVKDEYEKVWTGLTTGVSNEEVVKK